jgi:two-component system chemotaxis response regulator CheB
MSGSETIQVLIIDDSVLVRKYLSQVLSEIPGIEVIGTAPNGKIGLQKLFMLKPQVVVLDIEMPEMNGLDFLRYLKQNITKENRPNVIMFSSLVSEGSDETFEALANGAADFIKKPEGQVYDNIEFLRKEFDLKIRGLYSDRQVYTAKPEARLHEEPGHGALGTSSETAPMPDVPAELSALEGILMHKNIQPEIVAVGSSTGGPNAIRKMFDNLGPLSVPMVIAQHMPAGFTSEFARNLASIYLRDVFELSEGNVLKPGAVYICPGGLHSRIVRKGQDLVFEGDANNYDGFFFRPSVDIFFRSILKACGKNVLGIVLSGMGHDGSIESVNMRKAGALLFAQNRDSSVVWGMPGNSVRNGGIDLVLDATEIGTAVNHALSRLRGNA